MNINQKLACIQQELKAPKNQFNSHGKFSYRSCEDILEALKPILAKYKTMLMIQDNIKQVGDRYYVMAIATLYDLESEEIQTSTAFAREEESRKGMDASQITGSASSYARKYALNGMFMIDDTKDADSQEKPSEEPKTEPYATQVQLDIIRKNMDSQRIERMLTHHKKNKLEQLTLKEASGVIAQLKKEGTITDGTNQNRK